MYIVKLWAVNAESARGRKKIPTELRVDSDDITVVLDKVNAAAKAGDKSKRTGIARMVIERETETSPDANPFAK